MESNRAAEESGGPLRQRVLIVERDSAYADALEEAFRREGFEVRQVPDGAEAIAIIDDEPPALLILDLDTPVISGVRLLGLLRESLAGHDVPVLALAPLCAEDQAAAIAAGADAACCKLAPVDEIVTQAREVLQRSWAAPSREMALTP